MSSRVIGAALVLLVIGCAARAVETRTVRVEVGGTTPEIVAVADDGDDARAVVEWRAPGRLCRTAGCDPFDEHACAEGYECRRASPEGTWACVAPIAARGDGASCRTSAECAPRHVCSAAGTGEPRCLPLCDRDGDCGDDEECAGVGGGCYGVCLPLHECSPTVPESCGRPTRTCGVWTDWNMEQTYALCVPVGALREGDDCEGPSACGPGLACLAQSCRRLCDDEHGCASGDACRGMFGAVRYCDSGD